MTQTERMAKVLEWRNSGEPVQAWCREQKIPYTTFINWRKESEASTAKSKVKSEPPVAWAPVQVESKPEPSQTVIRINCGDWVVELSSGETSEQRTITLRAVNAPC